MSLDLDKMLMAHIRRHDETGVHYALALGASPDARESDGHSALMCAALHNQAGIVKVLVSAGGDVDACDSCGLSPLMWAVMHGRRDAARALLDAGCRTDLKDDQGRSAADMARDGLVEILAWIEAKDGTADKAALDARRKSQTKNAMDNVERFYKTNPPRRSGPRP